MAQAHRIFGIRHHGPGSARALLNALTAWQPDCILIEGPTDANDILHFVGHELMEPPVALLIYRPNEPGNAGMFPFAAFSPEFQALKYGFQRNLPVRFFDLPYRYKLALNSNPWKPPIEMLAQMVTGSGFQTYEQWWDQLIEQQRNPDSVFTGIMEMMDAARIALEDSEADPEGRLLDDRREAFMREELRAAVGEGHERIAVIVGAWHAPALHSLEGKAADRALLRGLPEVEIASAWVPWTYRRMEARSGYGAGIHSPGWYDHLWQMSAQPDKNGSIVWLTKVAKLLREQGFDASAAHVIETVRLAEAVAALRELPRPSLGELMEATQTVMTHGAFEPLQLIERQLIVGSRLGQVPPGVPLVPLQRDLRNEQRRLDLLPQDEMQTLKIDLRKSADLERSHLLHRLALLDIKWGRFVPQRAQRGTYAEQWRLKWEPEVESQVILCNVWGNTVLEATTNFALDKAEEAKTLAELTKLLDGLILCDLPAAIDYVIRRIEEEAALSADVPNLIDALVPLANVLRYGTVRQTDRSILERIVNGLITRICINLPTTVVSLDDDAAVEMLEKLNTMHSVIGMLNHAEWRERWHEVLQKLADGRVHNLLAGRAARILFDGGVDSAETTTNRMERALAAARFGAISIGQLMQIAFWIEGFLHGSGLILLHDQLLWQLLDSWVQRLRGDDFVNVLPLLRRTFSGFNDSVRQQMHERVRGSNSENATTITPNFDRERADAAMQPIADLIGLALP